MTTVQNGKLFSCGNHSVETTKGMLHFGDPSAIISLLAVPSTMTVREVIQFLNPSMPDIENTRILREVNQDSTYIVLLTFRNEESAKQFYTNYNGKPFNSLEEHACKLLYVTRVETFSEDPARLEASSTCTVCLDGMYTDVESIITILCNHSFHTLCLSQWSDTSCPVCRYCQTPECEIENKCMDCSYEGESLWMCIICGYLACGRYINGHAIDHFKQTQHTYAMELRENLVWDYAADGYVHRLLANKVDGKPVEVEGADEHRQAEHKEAIQLEYTYLLTQQLESQRKYYEKLIKDNGKQCEKKVKDCETRQKECLNDLNELQEKFNQLLKDKSSSEKKLNSLQTKVAKLSSALSEEKQMNKCLTMNQEQFQQKIKDLEQELKSKQEKIIELEEQQRDLMFYVEARDKIDNSVAGNEVSRAEMSTSQIVIQQQEPSTSNRSRLKNNRRNKHN